jgi:hypothetical protein
MGYASRCTAVTVIQERMSNRCSYRVACSLKSDRLVDVDRVVPHAHGGVHISTFALFVWRPRTRPRLQLYVRGGREALREIARTR